MATVSYPPFYTQKITDGEGQPVAGGKILSFYAGTDVPLAVYTEDGTSLGAEVDIDGDGYACFCLKTGLSYKLVCKYADGSIVWTRDNVRVNVSGDGMANPMEAEGDIIVGGPDGQPDRLAHGTTGQVLKIGADGNPGWATDAEGMTNPMSSFGQMISGGLAGAPNVLAAPTGDQYLGVTSTVYGPFPQWWPLINAIVKGLATTPAGTASGFTKGDLILGGDAISGGALHNYTGVDRLPIGTSGKILTSNGTTATWADPVTQEGDHKAKTSATDSDPNFLENKVLGGDLIQVEKEQTPDGDGGYFENLRVHLDARGVTAGYVPTADGSNGAAWAAPAAGGGGGGGDFSAQPFGPPNNTDPKIDRRCAFVLPVFGGTLPPIVKSFSFFITQEIPANLTNFRAVAAIYDGGTLISPFTWANHSTFSTRTSTGIYHIINYDSPVVIDPKKTYSVYFWYNQDNYTNIRFFISRTYGTPLYSGPRMITMNADPGDHYGNAPASSSSITGSSTYVTQMPWIGLNSFAGQED